MPFQNHLEFILKTASWHDAAPDCGYNEMLVYAIENHCTTQSSLRDSHPVLNKYPALR